MIQKWRVFVLSIMNLVNRSQALKKIVISSSWLAVERIFRMIISFFVGIAIARYLGPEQFGQLNYAQSFVALFSTVATLGLEGIVVRNIVRQPERKDEILGSTFVLKLFGSLSTIVLTIALITVLRPEDHYMQWMVALVAMGMILQSFDTIDYWFQSQVNAKVKVYTYATSFFLISMLKVVLIVLHAPLIAFAYAGMAEAVIIMIGLLIGYRVHGNYVRKWRVSLGCAIEMLKDSWPLILSSLAILIYMRIDQIMIGDMVGDHELGIYSVVVRLGEMWYFVPLAIVSSTYPSIVQSKQISDEVFYERLQNLYDVMAFIGYIVAIAMTFFAPFLVSFFGQEYKTASSLLICYIWIGLFVNLGVARTSFLNTMNYTKWQFITSFMGCVLNVLLNFLLIPRYGAMGATVASLFSYWFQTHGSCYFFRPLYQTGTMQTKAILVPFRLRKIISQLQVRSKGEYL
ncbi:flippase [Brevibacillus choshinensis]|uniref:Flippase n=1 Tax=Brevibacillus choshinensis TaxID=54911 RepID=A0ABX7FLQ8_BRECH|nr:flippase [Brevibacillus choshinensis]QRG66231.1 flippase [Brevibacillus choshinensis]